jgi:hypothetical protein
MQGVKKNVMVFNCTQHILRKGVKIILLPMGGVYFLLEPLSKNCFQN